MKHGSSRATRPSLRGRVASALCGVATSAWAANAAHAADVEYVGQGTRPLGRGGAFAARADDPMALSYNPAALADQRSQAMLNLNNAFYDACVTREGTYADNVDTPNSTTQSFGDFQEYGSLPFPRVCQNNRINPGLWLIGTHRISERLGLGFGIVTPSAAAHLIWGDGEGATKDGNLPSPVRYQLVEQEIKLFQPTLGFGYRVSDWLKLGVSVQWGIALIKNVNYSVANPGEDPSGDNRAELEVSDYFVPAVIPSLHIVPHDNVDVVLRGRWSDAIRAQGSVKIRVKDFDTVLATDSSNDAKVDSPQPGYVGIALRYADRKTPRVDGQIGDPLVDESWDIEIDANYVFTSQFDAISVDLPSLPNAGIPDGLEFDLEHRWKDQISVRVGGDYNVVPGKLALRAGAHYESSAIDGSYMGIDFQPAQRLGLHGGLTYRVGRWDLSLAYAHIFQETVTVPKSAAAYTQVSASLSYATPVPGDVVNAGTYEASYDVVSLGVNVAF